jgi:hypothetical protein
MTRSRLSLFHYDLVRELCEHCRNERFHFVPIDATPEPGRCSNCGRDRKLAELSDTSIIRLVTQPNGEVVVVPLIG